MHATAPPRHRATQESALVRELLTSGASVGVANVSTNPLGEDSLAQSCCLATRTTSINSPRRAAPEVRATSAASPADVIKVRLQLQRMALPDGTKPPGLVSKRARPQQQAALAATCPPPHALAATLPALAPALPACAAPGGGGTGAQRGRACTVERPGPQHRQGLLLRGRQARHVGGARGVPPGCTPSLPPQTLRPPALPAPSGVSCMRAGAPSSERPAASRPGPPCQAGSAAGAGPHDAAGIPTQPPTPRPAPQVHPHEGPAGWRGRSRGSGRDEQGGGRLAVRRPGGGGDQPHRAHQDAAADGAGGGQRAGALQLWHHQVWPSDEGEGEGGSAGRTKQQQARRQQRGISGCRATGCTCRRHPEGAAA
jgi:hypothetical protein